MKSVDNHEEVVTEVGVERKDRNVNQINYRFEEKDSTSTVIHPRF